MVRVIGTVISNDPPGERDRWYLAADLERELVGARAGWRWARRSGPGSMPLAGSDRTTSTIESTVMQVDDRRLARRRGRLVLGPQVGDHGSAERLPAVGLPGAGC